MNKQLHSFETQEEATRFFYFAIRKFRLEHDVKEIQKDVFSIDGRGQLILYIRESKVCNSNIVILNSTALTLNTMNEFNNYYFQFLNIKW